MKPHHKIRILTGFFILLAYAIGAAICESFHTPTVNNVEVLLYVAEGQTPIRLLIPKEEAFKILGEKPLTVLRVEVKKKAQ